MLLVGAPAQSADPPLRVVVCASHHHVLRYWLLAAAEGRIPARDVSVVHFDAHPDMAVPPRVLARGWRAEPGRVVAANDIASFQLAAAWVRLVHRVTWLRPAWALQLPDGERRFRLGMVPGRGMRVDDESDYYVLDDAWSPRAELRDPVEVTLDVATLADAASGAFDLPRAEILDVDLDGFATRNPAADRLRAAGLDDRDLDVVRHAFDPVRLALGGEPQERIAGLDRLLTAVGDAAAGDVFARMSAGLTLWRMGVSATDLWRLATLLFGDVDVDALLSEGRDLVGLPEHRPGSGDVATTAKALEATALRMRPRPALVTIARSVGDGFTPSEAWPEAERATLAALTRALGPIDVHYDRGLSPAP